MGGGWAFKTSKRRRGARADGKCKEGKKKSEGLGDQAKGGGGGGGGSTDVGNENTIAR